MLELWLSLPNLVQDLAVLIGGLVPLALLSALLFRGFRPKRLILGLLHRYVWASLAFTTLIAVSVAMGVGVLAQERALRFGTAAAAEKFEMIISPPGSDVTMMLATVYLQPGFAGLIPGETFVEIAEDPGTTLVAPLAFGDSVGGAPVVGTTHDFLTHLTGTDLPPWTGEMQAIVGSKTDFAVGDVLQPTHGVHGDVGETHDVDIEVIARMPETGSPWDAAVVTPIESVWSIHGLANGHAPDNPVQLGPPYDAAYFPGTPAIIVTAESLGQIYTLRSRYTREGETMAFFPGAVLNRLHGTLGDVRQVMSVLTLLTQGLVAIAVLLGLFILSQLFQRQMAVLRALGAPNRFVVAVLWGFAMGLIVAGVLAGIVLGYGAAAVISSILSERTGVQINAILGWPEFHILALFLGLAAFAALLPAWGALRRPVVDALRG